MLVASVPRNAAWAYPVFGNFRSITYSTLYAPPGFGFGAVQLIVTSISLSATCGACKDELADRTGHLRGSGRAPFWPCG